MKRFNYTLRNTLFRSEGTVWADSLEEAIEVVKDLEGSLTGKLTIRPC